MFVSFWYLLTITSVCLPLAGAMLAAKAGHYGSVRLVLAVIIGLMLATGNFVAMRSLQTNLRDVERPAAWISVCICGGVVMWAFITMFLAYFVTPWLIDSVAH